MRYVWKCPECGDRQEYASREPQECPLHDKPVEMRRDWRAESVSIDRFKSFGDGKVHADYIKQDAQGNLT
jgi:hypothetical protein